LPVSRNQLIWRRETESVGVVISVPAFYFGNARVKQMTPLHHSCGTLYELRQGQQVHIGDRPYIVKKRAQGGMGFILFLELDRSNAPGRFSVHGLRVVLKSILPAVLDDDLKRELWCYEMAAAAKAPQGCKFPATRQQKAKAHCFAFTRITAMSFTWEFYMKKRGAGADEIARAREEHSTDEQRADAHKKRAKELVPEVDWDDQAQITKFMQSVN
jgi:hypothetical protein